MRFFSTSDDEVRRLSVQVGHLSSRVEHLTKAVERLAREQGVGPAVLEELRSGEEPFWAQVRQLKASGSAIQAIKLVREQTGMGLREAKDAVDRL